MLKRILAALAVCGVGLGGCSDSEPTEQIQRHRAVGFGWEDTALGSDLDWTAIGEDLVANGYDTADLAIGRPEWTMLDWRAHPDVVAPQVGNIELITTDLGEAGIERIVLTVDNLLPEWLSENEEWMAVSVDGGVGYEDVPSLAAWAVGPAGDRLEEYVTALAEEYPQAEGIVLTEFFFNQGTFTDHDLELWQADTGNDDWPRDSEGDIEMTTEYLEWLTSRSAEFLARIDAAAGDVPLIVDVRIEVEDPTAGHPESGHDIDKILANVDMVQPWVYYTTGEEDSAVSAVNELNEKWPGKVRPALGLWEADALSVADVMREASDSPLLQVTPYSLMDGKLPKAQK